MCSVGLKRAFLHRDVTTVDGKGATLLGRAALEAAALHSEGTTMNGERARKDEVFVLSDSGCTWTVYPESKKPQTGLTVVEADGAFGSHHHVDADEQDEAIYGGEEYMMSDRQAVRGGWVKICMDHRGSEDWV